jgi:RNA polymerase sigma-70 factor (ECF subfamily)
MTTHDNEALVRQLACDLDTYFEQLVLSYQHRLRVFVTRQAGSPQIAEDVVQEAFLRAYTTLEDYPSERIRELQLSPWLYRITLNTFYGFLRKAKLQQVSLETLIDHPDLEIEDSWQDQPELVAQDREWLRELEAKVALLPSPFREVINLYYFEELSYTEMADVLQQPLGTIKSRLYRGTQLLRQALKTQQSEVKHVYEAR